MVSVDRNEKECQEFSKRKRKNTNEKGQRNGKCLKDKMLLRISIDDDDDDENTKNDH